MQPLGDYLSRVASPAGRSVSRHSNDLILDYGYGCALYAADVLDVLRKAGRSVLDAAEALARREDIKSDSVLLETLGGPAADMILAQAKEWAADLIVMGTHGRRGLARMVMGSDAEGVLRGSNVPVLLVRGAPRQGAVAQHSIKASTA